MPLLSSQIGFQVKLIHALGVVLHAIRIIGLLGYHCISMDSLARFHHKFKFWMLLLICNNITGKIPPEFGYLTSLTTLDLEDNRLTGEIPPSLGKLVHIEFLILSHNNLKGRIPDSLSNLSTLSDLRLDSNNLSGQVPSRLFQISKYNFSGNDLVCSPHPCASVISGQGEKKSKIGIVFGSVGGAIALLFCCAVLFLLWKHKHKGYRRDVFKDVPGEDDHRIAFGQLKRFSWRELQLATEDFSEENVLGKGGFGKSLNWEN